MKKIAVLGVLALAAGLGSCSTKCPAYTQQKPATQQASAVTASAAAAPAERQ
ncbi:hypothetical protein [Hymenobacter oligotrophus]|uniref:hypothetical protein n=1 Tax=Hymenobacter oligotrophus TaxID=2319843 RepID=UPI0013C2B824|nr:hypothetical protein [Hymenobacter oligotrophus]